MVFCLKEFKLENSSLNDTPLDMSLFNNKILDNLLEGFQVIGFDWRYLYLNETVARQGQSTVQNLMGKTIMECYPGFEKTDVFKKLKKCMIKRVPLQFENKFINRDGSIQWFELRVEPTEQGIIVLSFDCTNRKLVEEELVQLKESLERKVEQRTKQLQKLVSENDVILKEMHHRVKNNLQIISSLIRLQMDENDIEYSDVLEKTQARIETIASIHESLYKHKNLALIDVSKFWKKLFNDCMKSMTNEPTNFKLNIDFQKIHFPVDRMIPLGLLINELITNTIQHGFANRKHGEITLSLKKQKGDYLLVYRDDGAGSIEPIVGHNDDNQHLGHFLIDGFVEQLGGVFRQVSSDSGIYFEIQFPDN